MRRGVGLLAGVACGAALALDAGAAWGQASASTSTSTSTSPSRWAAPDGAALVRLLGARAVDAFAVPGAGARGIHARVVLPSGISGADVGLTDMAPGVARLSGTPSTLLAFADAHPDLRLEVAPPLHTLLDTAAVFVAATGPIAKGMDGSGTLVGIADTGIDVTHPDFLDAQGHTRIAWLLDLSAPPRGVHADLEQTYGIPAVADASGAAVGPVVDGAVWSAADLDAAMANQGSVVLPQDEFGHGTLVSACAAANGIADASPYRGIAPGATLLVARITAAGTDAIDIDDVLRGVGFLFDRADATGEPVVVNLSLGTDFGPHDGTTAWEQTLASYVGPDHPGRALVAAAGNSGSIASGDGTLVHQNVHVNEGTTTRLPIPAMQSLDGGVQVWIAMHAGAALRVGLDGPDGTWIAPVASGESGGKETKDYNAAVQNGNAAGSPVPAQSHGAVAIWQGAWPAGTYYVTLSGSGTADLYVQGVGDARSPPGVPVGFADGVREGTVSLPATSPSILGVGCTINKPSWTFESQVIDVHVPLLDAVGGMPNAQGAVRDAIGGEPCWFSSAGPTLTGLAKPEIAAPGAAIAGALSQRAVPPSITGIFSNASCVSNVDPRCQIIDPLHAVSAGTSFSAPIVSGAIAVLLQHDPALTQDAIVAALQGGAHRDRGPTPFDDQAGPGELDVQGALAAVDAMQHPIVVLPARSESWMTLGAEMVLADGSTPLQAVVELRGLGDGDAPVAADGFSADRLAAYATVDGQPYAGAAQLTRKGPGVWLATVQLPAGLGGSRLTVGVNLDGAPIVDEKTVPIAVDVWSASYPVSARGGCAVAASGRTDGAAGCIACGLVALGLRRRRRRVRGQRASRDGSQG
jgi:hypothetical protein